MESIQRYTEDYFIDMMSRSGLRPSMQRLLVIRQLSDHLGHPAADDIYKELLSKYPTLSRTTVYNSLHALVEHGLVRELEADGIKRYDPASLAPHGHFICRKCGAIFDMPLPADLLPEGDSGFEIDAVDLYYKGICPDCRRKEEC